VDYKLRIACGDADGNNAEVEIEWWMSREIEKGGGYANK
jgi:hypothetical protein